MELGGGAGNGVSQFLWSFYSCFKNAAPWKDTVHHTRLQ